jgi:glutathione S-transferase
MITLYDHPRSGNCHKVRLLLSMLGLPHESRFVEVLEGVHNEPWFVELNPLRQIPVLSDGGFRVQDSQAILVYLARRYGPDWLPNDPEGLARTMEWLSFAANEIGNSLQPARLFFIVGEHTDIALAQAKGRRALGHLDARLAGRDWLAAERATVADLACFPYVGLCREGRLPLDEFRHVGAWIERIRQLPGYIAMEGLPDAPAPGALV